MAGLVGDENMTVLLVSRVPGPGGRRWWRGGNVNTSAHEFDVSSVTVSYLSHLVRSCGYQTDDTWLAIIDVSSVTVVIALPARAGSARLAPLAGLALPGRPAYAAKPGRFWDTASAAAARAGFVRRLYPTGPTAGVPSCCYDDSRGPQP
jgi:hypothetical protein